VSSGFWAPVPGSGAGCFWVEDWADGCWTTGPESEEEPLMGRMLIVTSLELRLERLLQHSVSSIGT
jgi:hypothetical protein